MVANVLLGALMVPVYLIGYIFWFLALNFRDIIIRLWNGDIEPPSRAASTRLGQSNSVDRVSGSNQEQAYIRRICTIRRLLPLRLMKSIREQASGTENGSHHSIAQGGVLSGALTPSQPLQQSSSSQAEERESPEITHNEENSKDTKKSSDTGEIHEQEKNGRNQVPGSALGFFKNKRSRGDEEM
ncbi:MAG: hypothetical protein M1834_005274 [Cirrosporium novae-zelandiae]|nr:MAG: hypothetical protein M1834_005274 [Cirrosporium novae-zelandiae]